MSEPVYDQQDADNYYLATENRALRDQLATLVRALDALVKTWKRRADAHEAMGDNYSIVAADILDICADDLAAVLSGAKA